MWIAGRSRVFTSPLRPTTLRTFVARAGTAVTLCALSVAADGCSSSKATVPTTQSSGFAMATDSFDFPNFANGFPSSVMTPALMVRMFGSGVCVAGMTASCTLTPAAQAWMSVANDQMNGGRCEGFAVLSSLISSGVVDPTTFGGTTARDLTLYGNFPLQSELAYWFSTQLVHEVVADKTQAYEPKNVMPFLATALAPSSSQRWRLGIVRKVGNTLSGGHSLTPIGYSLVSSGVYSLGVYDNNTPDAEGFVTIDTNANTWQYEASPNPEEESVLYSGTADNANPMYFAPIFTREGTLPCDFCKGSGSTTTDVLTSGGVQAAAGGSGASGATSSPSFSDTLNGTPPSSVVTFTATGDYTLALSAGDPTQALIGGAAVLGTGYSVSARGLSLAAATDSIAVGSQGQNVTYTNTSGTGLTLSTAVDTANNTTIQVTVTVTGASQSVSTSIDPTTGTIAVTTNAGAGTSVGVTVGVTDDGSAVAQTGELDYIVTGAGASTLSAGTTPLSSGGTLTGTVTQGGTTTTVTSTGSASCAGTGTNCGGNCPTACALGQGCSVAGDCQSTFCQATTHVCVADACEDGTQDGQETDVDCGGGTCAACPNGDGCAIGSDCTSTACTANKCVATYTVGVTVLGLPGGNSLTLQDNGGDNLIVQGDGSYGFATPVTGAYDVTILAPPSVGTCQVVNGSGTATSGVVVTVTCTSAYEIGGQVTGLDSGKSVVLQDNGGDNLTVSANGTFQFPTAVSGTYAVSVFSQPANATCAVASGSGMATANVTGVAVTCTDNVVGFTIGGTITGLDRPLTITDNGGDSLVLSASGSFTFPTPVASGGTYSVGIGLPAVRENCPITNATGTASANVTNVIITCAPTERLAFVTSNQYSGGIGGITAANAACAQTATAAGVVGTYYAWLNDGVTFPANEFTQSAVPYVLVNGTEVAANWAGLTSGTLEAAINLTESGGSASATVWTDVAIDGTSVSGGVNCGAWLSSSPTGNGLQGDPTSTNENWTNGGIPNACNMQSPFYCFEQ